MALGLNIGQSVHMMGIGHVMALGLNIGQSKYRPVSSYDGYRSWH